MKIDHLNIVCSNLEKSATFYETLFGFRRGFQAHLQGDWIAEVTGLPGAEAHCRFLDPPDGGTRIELISYIHPTGATVPTNSRANTFGLRHFAFEVDDIDLLLLKLEKQGVVPLSPPVAVPFQVASLGTKRLLYFLDPDGSLVEAASYDKP